MIMNEKMNATLGNAFPKERIRYAMLSFFLAQGLCFLGLGLVPDPGR